MNRLLILASSIFIMSCYWNSDRNDSPGTKSSLQPDSLRSVADITLPPGYHRTDTASGSFGAWLRRIALKKDRHVYLYNGQLKGNQTAQFAVLDIPVGNKDLQQCADALMRLRAEYLFDQKKFSAITFSDNAGKSYTWTGGADRSGFDTYLEKVFGMCGSASLEKQLKPVHAIADIQAGDVFIKGGFPGHAMIVVEVAVNDKGQRSFMLAQSYMPAQDIHIVRNPAADRADPWYEVNGNKEIITPQWIFLNTQLRRW